jgi:hypothetical protein
MTVFVRLWHRSSCRRNADPFEDLGAASGSC